MAGCRRHFFGAFLALLLVASGAFAGTAVAAPSQMRIVLLIQEDYYSTSADDCQIEPERTQPRVLLKVNDHNGRRAGGAWFASGQEVFATGPSGVSQTYCAWVQYADVQTTGTVDVLLHNVYLTSVNLNSFDHSAHLVLEVDSRGLVAEDAIDDSDVAALGLEPLASVASHVDEADEPVTRTTRSSRSGESTSTSTRSNSTETGSTSTSSRSSSTSSSQPSGIITGDWELEGPTVWDELYVIIEPDPWGEGEYIVEDLDPIEIAVEAGMPLIGEGRAPEGCRIFAFSGPLGSSYFMAFCADGDFLLMSVASDKEILDDVVADFVRGLPFKAPPGYWPL